MILGKVITFEENPSLLWGYCHFIFVCDHFYRVIITLDLPANPQTILGWSTPPPFWQCKYVYGNSYSKQQPIPKRRRIEMIAFYNSSIDCDGTYFTFLASVFKFFLPCPFDSCRCSLFQLVRTL